MVATMRRPATTTADPTAARRAYDLGEIARMGPYHVHTLRTMIEAGTLRATKVGKRWIVPAAEVARLLRALLPLSARMGSP